jgi:hypothetical protein
MTETEAPQMMSQYGSYELRAVKAKHGRVCTRPRARVLTRTHTQTNKQYLWLSTAKTIRERALLLRCTYIACLV